MTGRKEKRNWSHHCCVSSQIARFLDISIRSTSSAPPCIIKAASSLSLVLHLFPSSLYRQTSSLILHTPYSISKIQLELHRRHWHSTWLMFLMVAAVRRFGFFTWASLLMSPRCCEYYSRYASLCRRRDHSRRPSWRSRRRSLLCGSRWSWQH